MNSNRVCKISDHIRNLCKHGRVDTAFRVVDNMERHRLHISRDIIYSLLQGCHGIKDLAYARRIHNLMQKHKLSSITALGDHLIRLFSACRSLHEANKAFFDISDPTVFTWNSIISAHAKLGDGQNALRLFEEMQKANVMPDRVTFVCLCHACGCTEALRAGMYMHHQAIRGGFESDLVLGNALIEMYASCGYLPEACKLFNTQVVRDIITWTNIISGHATHGQGLHALSFYSRLQYYRLKPNAAIFVSTMKACAHEGALNEGQLIHGEILEDGMESDAMIMSSLADMYSKNGCLADSGKVFISLSSPDVVSWSAMIDGHAQNGDPKVALQFFVRMLHASVKPNDATFLGILRACSRLSSTKWLKCVYSYIIEEGFETNVAIGSALVDTFANFKSLEDANFVFAKLANKNVVAWGAVISGFLECGQAVKALELFHELLLEGSEPNSIICVCSLKACGRIEDIEQGSMIHVLIVQMGFESDNATGNTLVDFYAKIGDLDSARIVFCGLSSPDAVSFGALIAGYSRQGWNSLALNLYDQMQKKGVLPDKATFLSLLKACGNMGAVEQGHLLHEQIVLNGLDSAVFVNNALVDMYSKTKRVDEAGKLLAIREKCDAVSFSSIIAGLEQQADLDYLIQFVVDVLQEDGNPDSALLARILTSCCSAGLLNEGNDLFASTSEDNPWILTREHYSSTVDLFGRAGHLQWAKDVSVTMPMRPDMMTEMSLFASSKTYISI